MPAFAFKAVTKSGVIVKNKVEAPNKDNLINQLKNNDLYPIEVTLLNHKKGMPRISNKGAANLDLATQAVGSASIRQGTASSIEATKEKLRTALSIERRITVRDVIIFTQNFYLLKKAGFNNIHALETIINSTENYTFRRVLEDILSGVENGEYMHTTMEYYSDIFSFIYINMIKVGELSGSLTKSLEEAVKYLEETTARKKKINNIVIPNILQFAAIVILLIVGTIFILPVIQDVFNSLGQGLTTLPPITLWFMDFVNNLTKYWYIPTGIIALIVFCIVNYISTPTGKYKWHHFKYTVPVFGRLIFAMDFSRLMRAMLLNLQNGMRIQEALDVSKTVIKNEVMLAVIEASINNILEGGSWIEPFEASGLCSAMELEMLKIGMQTDLTEMIAKLLEYMDVDIQNSLNKMMKVLPEISYFFVGIMLIFLVIVLIVPCIQLYMGEWLLEALRP